MMEINSVAELCKLIAEKAEKMSKSDWLFYNDIWLGEDANSGCLLGFIFIDTKNEAKDGHIDPIIGATMFSSAFCFDEDITEDERRAAFRLFLARNPHSTAERFVQLMQIAGMSKKEMLKLETSFKAALFDASAHNATYAKRGLE